MEDQQNDPSRDSGSSRRGFLKCMAFAGTGVLWSMNGGIFTSRALAQDPTSLPSASPGTLHFVQISDSHIGFKKPANPDVAATFREAIKRINVMPHAPEFILHTGDLTHLSEAKQFDDLAEMMKECEIKDVHYVPGEHDVLSDNGDAFRERFGKGTEGAGWKSFDQKGVHFVGLVNVQGVSEGGFGKLGAEQIEWLTKDLASLTKETPVVVYAHVPLWMVDAKFRWGTDDGEKALALLKGFGSVTVLNGHIHQVIQKVEGNLTFHTARSTAFPQPEPGKAEKPGPLQVEAEKLRSFLGLTSVTQLEQRAALAVIDTTLEAD